MPKFVFPLDSLTYTDKQEVGENLATLSEIGSAGGRLLPGFVIGYNGFDEVFSEHWQDITKLLAPVKKGNLDEDFFTSLRSLLKRKIQLPKQLVSEVTERLGSGYYTLESFVAFDNREFKTNLGQFKGRASAEEFVLSGFFSFLSVDIFPKINLENLSKIQVSLALTKKLSAEVTGFAEVSPPKRNETEISAFWGEGEVSQTDKVVIKTSDGSLINYLVTPQTEQTVWIKDKYQNVPIPKKFQGERKLEESDLTQISKVLRKVQDSLLSELAASFIIDEGKVYFTSLTKNSKVVNFPHVPFNLQAIQSLHPLFPGIASGVVRYIRKNNDLQKLKRGDIAVINSFKKENLKFLKKASGVIVERAAHLQKEHHHLLQHLGVTMAVGDLNHYIDGVVTLDGKNGKIYKGSFFPLAGKLLEPKQTAPTLETRLVTATKVLAQITLPQSKDFSSFDALGPVALEGFTEKEARDLCAKASGRTIIFQLSPRKARSFQREIKILKKLRRAHGFRNFWLSLPATATHEEINELKKFLAKENLHSSHYLKILSNLVTPANVLSIEKLISYGIDGVLVDYTTLANLTYDKDFSVRELKQLQDSSLERVLENLISLTSKNSLFSLVYNLPAETENSILKKLVARGLSAVSVKDTDVNSVRQELALYERELVVHGK